MKYIIDIPNADVSRWVAETPLGKKLYIPISVEDGNEYSIATEIYAEEYTEPDRKAIEDEVWSLAREIAYCMSLQECIDTGMLHDDDIYDSASGVLEKLTYQEAKARYDAWLKKKDDIRVGDEVRYHGNKYVVGYVGVDEVYHIVDRNWIRTVVQGDYQIFKTGRHFPEVAELLKKMRGGITCNTFYK